jgi:peptide chain release factor 2
MDGDLDGFIEAFLKKKLGKGSDQLSLVSDADDI